MKNGKGFFVRDYIKDRRLNLREIEAIYALRFKGIYSKGNIVDRVVQIARGRIESPEIERILVELDVKTPNGTHAYEIKLRDGSVMSYAIRDKQD